MKVTPLKEEEMVEKEGPETPPESPLFELTDAVVKKLIRSANERGYVTHNQLDALLSSDELKSEQIEEILAKFSEMGVNVVETKEARPEEEAAPREEPEVEETEGENELVEIRKHAVPAKSGAKEPAERSDDPVRLYLREMASVQLLSREGEIAIAKRIEAGREAMIAGLCESPLTFQAIIIWRDELNDGKVFAARHHRPRCTLCRPRGSTPADASDRPRRTRAAAADVGAGHCACDRHPVQAGRRKHRRQRDDSLRDDQRE